MYDLDTAAPEDLRPRSPLHITAQWPHSSVIVGYGGGYFLKGYWYVGGLWGLIGFRD